MNYFWAEVRASWKTETATAFDRALLVAVAIGFVAVVWFLAATRFWLSVPNMSSLTGDGIAWVQAILGLSVLAAVAIGLYCWRELSVTKRTSAIQLAGMSLMALQGFVRIGARPGSLDSFLRLSVSWALIGAGVALFAVSLAYRHFARIPSPGGLEG